MNFRRPLILLVLAALLPLVILSAWLGVAALRQRQVALESEAQARVDQASILVDRELQGQAAVLTAMAQLPALDPPFSEPSLRAIIERIRRHQPQWRTVVLTDLQGARLLAMPNYAPTLARVPDLRPQQEVVRTGRPGFTAARGGLIPEAFIVRVPVVRDGRTHYVLSAAMHRRAITGALRASDLPRDWIGAVLDRGGRIVARTEGSADLVGSLDAQAAREAIRHGESGVYRGLSLEGRPMVSAYRVVPSTGWSVHISIPRQDYNAPLRRALWLLVAGASASLLLAALFLWLMARELQLRRSEQVVVEEVARMEALGRMTGGVAHDFNNLLMIVQGSAELLKRRLAEPDRIATYADAILSACQRGQGLTRQLLAFARRSAHEPSAFDLQPRIDELKEMLERSTRGDVAVTVTAPDDTWTVLADKDALDIALINLAVNARDAMPEGGTLALSCRNVVLAKNRGEIGLEGEFVALTVQDSGAGIDPQHLPHIFEPFYTTKPSGKGTGLGLSQVYGFARQAGGAVTVSSPPGQGASFTLYLPRAAIAARPIPVRSERPTDAQQGRLLLVEDNDEVGEVTQAMLEDAGYTVTRVHGAAAALKLIEAGEPFDVVLSDIVMEGGMSGLELAPLLVARRPGLPIQLMTGYSEALARGAGCGFPVLPKPFQQAQLIGALAAARERASPALSS